MLYGQTDLEAKLVALKVYSIERDTMAGALFLNGYFDEMVKNTANKYDDSLIPAYMRLAIMRIEITPKIMQYMLDACAAIGGKAGPKREYPFNIIKSRSIFDSALDYFARRLRALASKAGVLRHVFHNQNCRL